MDILTVHDFFEDPVTLTKNLVNDCIGTKKKKEEDQQKEYPEEWNRIELGLDIEPIRY